MTESAKGMLVRCFAAIAVVLLLACGAASRAQSPATPTSESNKLPRPVKVTATYLPNAYWIHGNVISGGLPVGEVAFLELERLGVKTIISVDGAKPDVALAQSHGMRYVHLPHGYDGISQQRAFELAKAVRELPGPIYLHCHHGRHRSPAAAAVACVGAGLLNPEAAEAVLTTAGTSQNYRGLYQAARAARRLADETLQRTTADFPQTARVAPLAEAMVAMEHTLDHLKEIAAAGWISPPTHPDLDPGHEALLLREHFTELLRGTGDKNHPEEFLRYMRDGEKGAEELEWQIRQPAQFEKLTAAFKTITQSCLDCHQRFRDVPLDEKAKP